MSDAAKLNLDGQLNVLSGYPFPSGQFTIQDATPLIRIRDLQRGATETNFKGSYDPSYVVHTNDVLIGMDGDFVVVRWKGPTALLNQRVCKVTALGNDLDQGFLYWWLQPHVGEIHRRTPQTTVRHLSVGDLYRIPRPQIGLNSQRVAAVVFDAVDAAIERTGAVIAKLKQVRAGLLHDLLTCGLDDNGELRDPLKHPEQFQDSAGGRIPTKWEIRKLCELADIGSGVTLGRNLDRGGSLVLPYLRVANVQDGYLNLSDVKTIRIYPTEVDRYRLQHGDVLMNEGGDYDKLGRGTVWESQIPVCLHQNHVFRVRCNPELMNGYFAAFFSGSSIGRSYFLRSSKQSTNLASINSTQLKAFQLPRPQMDEQERIVAILQSHDGVIGHQQRELKKLSDMKAGLMSDLLTSRVTVPETIATGAAP